MDGLEETPVPHERDISVGAPLFVVVGKNRSVLTAARWLGKMGATLAGAGSLEEARNRNPQPLAILIAVPVFNPSPTLTVPPVTLRSAVTAPPALVFTAMFKVPMFVVGDPTATLSPRFTVAVAPPVPVPVRLAILSVVTSRIP